MESSADLEQAADAADELRPPFRGFGDAGKDLEQCGLARTIAPDHCEGLTPSDLERDVSKRPEGRRVYGRSVKEEAFEDGRYEFSESPRPLETPDLETFAEALHSDGDLRHARSSDDIRERPFRTAKEVHARHKHNGDDNDGERQHSPRDRCGA